MKKKMKRLAVGAGAGVLTAAALAAAGAFMMSRNNRYRKAKAWTKKARHEVVKSVKAARRMSGTEYKRIVERATKRYGSLHNVSAREAVKVANDMKAEWMQIQKNAKKLAAMAQMKSSRRPRRKTRRSWRR